MGFTIKLSYPYRLKIFSKRNGKNNIPLSPGEYANAMKRCFDCNRHPGQPKFLNQICPDCQDNILKQIRSVQVTEQGGKS